MKLELKLYKITKFVTLIRNTLYRDSPDNTVSISTVPGLTQFFLKEIARIPPFNTILSEKYVSWHLKPGSRNPFFLLVTLIENNWVAKLKIY